MFEFLMSDVYLAGYWIMAGIICYDVFNNSRDWFKESVKDILTLILFYIIAVLTSWFGVGLVLAGIYQQLEEKRNAE